MGMNRFIVFYGQQLYGEYSSQEFAAQYPDFPDGCYHINPLGNWYIRIGGGLTPINYSDIPPEVRVNCLLLGIPV